ncbi:MAG TPA: SET domain-containing protein-lysine N-methyltransferase [Dehalococcoidia bacterium]|nr:SET domain-containing protein-lysine N-methyltransferase [Dehalococcoidia bacterium]
MPPKTPYIEVRKSRIQGRGVFATRTIRKGTRIIEYTGERISTAEADERYDDDTMERTHTFLFTVSPNTVIDATHSGSDARFINHSCDPNCEAVLEDGRIFIEALTTIRPGTELTYDYNLERGRGFKKEWEARYPCYCGSENCRGTLLKPQARRKPAANGHRKSSARKRTAATAR